MNAWLLVRIPTVGIPRASDNFGMPRVSIELWLESMQQSGSHLLDCNSMVLTATCKTALPNSRAGAPNCLTWAFNFQSSQFSSGISWVGVLDFGGEAVWSQQVNGGRWALGYPHSISAFHPHMGVLL